MMEAPLRAFLMMRTDDGAWTVTVCRDLGAVVRAWKGRKAPERDVAVLHVGFDRPPSHSFDEVADSHPGHMLLTLAAKYALPATFAASSSPVGPTEGAQVFIGLHGWGYSLEDPTIHSGCMGLGRKTVAPHGWVASFLEENPTCVGAFSACGIHDDASYIASEAELERDIRHGSGVFRTHHLVGTNGDDPCRLARAAPPWLAEREVAILDLPIRAKNVLRTSGVEIVQDLTTWTPVSLLERRNFGRTSLRDTFNALNDALNEGPLPKVTDSVPSEPSQMLTAMRESLLSCSDRERDILIRRVGFERKSQTLQEISTDLGISRERVRQVAKRAMHKWIHAIHWRHLLEQKIKRLLIGRDFPLPLAGVEAIDPWFEGMSSHQEFFNTLINTVCKDRIHVLEIGGCLYFSLIDQASWQNKISDASTLVSSGVGRDWSEAYARSLVYDVLPDTAKEFGPLLWDEASRYCHFSTSSDGSRTLIAYGRAAEQLVEAILAESEVPLHYTEITERASLRRGRSMDSRRVYSAAANVGLLFAPGTYGLARHVPLSDEKMWRICTEVEDIVYSEEPRRQWHTSELLSELSETLDAGFDGLDKYVLNMALAKSSTLKPLGKMIWAAVGEDVHHKTRIDIQQAIIAIIKAAGRPLNRNEIRERLTAVRGVNEFFQIFPTDPLIRVGRGVWGINGRDVPLSHEDQRELVEELVHLLDRNQCGIHSTELSGVLPLRDCPPDAFVCIAIQDGRLKMAHGGYVYLTDWGSPRRETIRQAVAAVLEGSTKPLTLDAIAASVQGRVGRTVENPLVSAALQALEAEFDDAAKEWTLNRSRP